MTRKKNFPLKTLVATGLAVALIGCAEKAEEPMDAGMTDASDEPVEGRDAPPAPTRPQIHHL